MKSKSEENLKLLHKHENTVKQQVRWLIGVVGVGSESMSLGFCQKQPMQIAFLAPDSGMATLAPLIVRDLFITHRGCEEGQRCLVLGCPLNSTCYSSYKRSATWKRRNLPKKQSFINLLKMLKKLEGWLERDIAKIDWQKDLTTVYEKPTLTLRREQREQ